MRYNPLSHFLNETEATNAVVVKEATITPGDYELYMVKTKSERYCVVIETDYAFVTDIPDDIEECFPVEVQGWLPLKSTNKEVSSKLLPRNLFKSDSVNESDEDWDNYHRTFYTHDGWKYALLRVVPKPE